MILAVLQSLQEDWCTDDAEHVYHRDRGAHNAQVRLAYVHQASARLRDCRLGDRSGAAGALDRLALLPPASADAHRGPQLCRQIRRPARSFTQR